MAETVLSPTNETPPVKENPIYNFGMVGLQIRLLLGKEALDPTRPLPGIKADIENSVNDPKNRRESTYNLLAKLSTDERIKYWEKRALQNESLKRDDAQKALWIKEIVEIYNDPKDSSYRDAFSQMHFGDINWKKFDENEAKNLYQRYFQDNNFSPITLDGKTTYFPSSVIKYIGDLASEYIQVLDQPDGSQSAVVKYEKLKADLFVIQNFSSIFGDNFSNEILAQLLDAEIENSIKDKQQQLLDATLKKETVGSEEKLRGNNLREREIELLEALNGAGKYKDTVYYPEEYTEPREWPERDESKPLTRNYRWAYEKAKPNPENKDETRAFPEAHLVENIVNPKEIAHKLKLRDTQTGRHQYDSIDEEHLANEIAIENDELKNHLARIGLNDERFIKILNSAMSGYRNFVENKYHLKLPDIGNIAILPIWGKTAEYFNPSRGALAFVKPTVPAIFMDISKIQEFAKTLKKEWKDLTPEEMGNLMTRVFNEIRPHEATHLSSDLAFWYVEEVPSGKKEKVTVGKLGPWMTKPFGVNAEGEIIAKERGRGIMEAVTVELTNQWAKSMDQALDVDAYRSERSVLNDLISEMMDEQHIDFDTTFSKFVEAYFTRDGFSHLAQELSGRTYDKTADGKLIKKGELRRPHYLSIIDALMEFEAKKAYPRGVLEYQLTRSYIQNRLTALQKQEILDMITSVEGEEKTADTGEDPGKITDLTLPEPIREYLKTKDPRIITSVNNAIQPNQPEPPNPVNPAKPVKPPEPQPIEQEQKITQDIVKKMMEKFQRGEKAEEALSQENLANLLAEIVMQNKDRFIEIVKKANETVDVDERKKMFDSRYLNFPFKLLKVDGQPEVTISGSKAKGKIKLLIDTVNIKPKVEFNFELVNDGDDKVIIHKKSKGLINKENSPQANPTDFMNYNMTDLLHDYFENKPLNDFFLPHFSSAIKEQNHYAQVDGLSLRLTPDNKLKIVIQGNINQSAAS